MCCSTMTVNANLKRNVTHADVCMVWECSLKKKKSLDMTTQRSLIAFK